MSKKENLKPFTSNQSRDEAVKNGRKGGKKSGEVRREKKIIETNCRGKATRVNA